MPRSSFPATGLAVLRDALAPGGRIIAVRRLRGGITAETVEVTLADAAGARRLVVLRRIGEHAAASNPDAARRTWRTLDALARLGLPVPRPLWSDPDGALFGRPTLVMERLPGRPNLRPRDPARWLAELAACLAQLHAPRLAPTGVAIPGTQPREPVDLSFLPDAAWIADYLRAPPADHGPDADHPDAPAVWAALRRLAPSVDLAPGALVHGDFWPGNVLLRRGRTTGIVDWDECARGPATRDVGCCRQDLAFLRVGGERAPDLLVEAYVAAGGQVRDLPFWDLFAAQSAFPDPARWWLPGYHDLGRTDITPDAMRRRQRAFIADALTRAT